MAVNALRVFGIGSLVIMSITSLITFILIITGTTYEPTTVYIPIGCGDMKSEYIGHGKSNGTLYFSFINPVEQNVTFTNCDTDSDAHSTIEMYLIDSEGYYIQSNSTNACYGDGCHDHEYCRDYGAETFTMENLAAGFYTIELIRNDVLIFSVQENDSLVVVEVFCNTSVPIQEIRQYDISCGETITGNLIYPDVAFFNFTNPQQQEVAFTNCDAENTELYLRNSSDDYVQSQPMNDLWAYGDLYCGEWVSRAILMMDSLSPGEYFIELIPEYLPGDSYNSTFAVSVICPKWQFDTIDCGQNLTVFTTNNSADYISINFTNPIAQYVTFGIRCQNYNYSLNYSEADEYHDGTAVFREINEEYDWMQNLWIDPVCYFGRYELLLSPDSYNLMFSLYAGSEHQADPLTVYAICTPGTDYYQAEEIEAYHVECGKSVAGNISEIDESIYFIFNNTRQQDVTFTTCHGTVWGLVYLIDSEGNNIIGQSKNQCYGGVSCFDPSYPCISDIANYTITFTMEALPIGQYTYEFYTASSGPNVPNVFDVELFCNLTSSTISMECDEEIIMYFSSGETQLVEFTNTKTQNVLFTNCDAGGDWIQFHLRNSAGEYVHNKSINECQGSRCYFAEGYCNDTHTVTFFMEDLPADVYTIELMDTLYSVVTYEYDFSVQIICDAIPCHSYEFTRNLTEIESHFFYECIYYVDTIDAIRSQFCSGESGLSIDGMQQMEEAYRVVDELGIGVGNNVLLLSLLFVNVSTAIFVIFGIDHLSLDINKQAITTVIVVTQFILFSSLLSFNSAQFGSCFWIINEHIDYAPTPFHFVVTLIFSVFCSFCSYFAGFTCCRKRYLTFLVCITMLVLPVTYWIIQPSWGAVSPDLVMMLLFVYLQSVLPLCLCKMSHRLSTLSQRDAWWLDFFLHVALILSGFLQFVWLLLVSKSQHSWSGLRLIYDVDFTWFPTFLWTNGYCSFIAQASWFNPVFILSNLYLLFSEFRVLAVLQNLILFLVFTFKWFDDSGYFCSAIVNVQYIVYSFLIPVYIFLLFNSLPALQRLKVSLLGIYLVALDVFLDMVVVFFFIAETEYIFAVLQILAIISGQVVGAASDVLSKHHGDFTITDKVMALTGFGRVWFTVNWWKETLTTEDDNGKYKALRKKHKIWDLLYESFPTVALQIFAAMTTTVSSTTLVVSIMTSVLSISFSITIYIKDLLSVTTSSSSSHTRIASTITASQEAVPDLTTIESSQRNTVQKGSNPMYLALFAFMFSDFYIRSIPTVMALAVLSTKWFDKEDAADFVWKMVIGCILFGMIAVFEFAANQKIRTPSHRAFAFIFKIFAASIFSSFYTMLCTLNVLKTDPFYAESVIFSKYLIEHGIRCALSMIFCIFSVAVIGGTSWYPWILSVLFMASALINGRSMSWIYESEFMSIQQKESQSIELQTVEKEMSDNMRTTTPSTETAEGNQSGLESVDLGRSEIQIAGQGQNGDESNDVVVDKTE